MEALVSSTCSIVCKVLSKIAMKASCNLVSLVPPVPLVWIAACVGKRALCKVHMHGLRSLKYDEKKGVMCVLKSIIVLDYVICHMITNAY